MRQKVLDIASFIVLALSIGVWIGSPFAWQRDQQKAQGIRSHVRKMVFSYEINDICPEEQLCRMRWMSSNPKLESLLQQKRGQ